MNKPTIDPNHPNDCKYADGTATGMISTCPRKAAENMARVLLSRKCAEFDQSETNSLLDYVCLACRSRRDEK